LCADGEDDDVAVEFLFVELGATAALSFDDELRMEDDEAFESW
jgi:hypothetical protein